MYPYGASYDFCAGVLNETCEEKAAGGRDHRTSRCDSEIADRRLTTAWSGEGRLSFCFRCRRCRRQVRVCSGTPGYERPEAIEGREANAASACRRERAGRITPPAMAVAPVFGVPGAPASSPAVLERGVRVAASMSACAARARRTRQCPAPISSVLRGHSSALGLARHRRSTSRAAGRSRRPPSSGVKLRHGDEHEEMMAAPDRQGDRDLPAAARNVLRPHNQFVSAVSRPSTSSALP